MRPVDPIIIITLPWSATKKRPQLIPNLCPNLIFTTCMCSRAFGPKRTLATWMHARHSGLLHACLHGPCAAWEKADLQYEGCKRVALNRSFSGLVSSRHNSKCGGSYAISHVGTLSLGNTCADTYIKMILRG